MGIYKQTPPLDFSGGGVLFIYVVFFNRIVIYRTSLKCLLLNIAFDYPFAIALAVLSFEESALYKYGCHALDCPFRFPDMLGYLYLCCARVFLHKSQKCQFVKITVQSAIQSAILALWNFSRGTLEFNSLHTAVAQLVLFAKYKVTEKHFVELCCRRLCSTRSEIQCKLCFFALFVLFLHSS